MSLFTLPIYPILYKEPMLGGIPINMGALNLAGIAMGLLVFGDIALTVIFIFLHIIIFILMKSMKKFDTKIMDIVVRKNFRRYISY